MQERRYKPSEIGLLPNEPGIYKYYNKDEKIIYVGKAKSIKKRVSSYFNKSGHLDRKTARLVSEVRSIAYAIVNSEFDALLLENNIIKENQPKYNILLKDDKSFPYLCILNERFPRVIATRKYIPSQGEYFGPYSSVSAMNSVLGLIRKLYKIRTCKLNLSQKNIEEGKFKVCLEYHIGNCKGPCENLQALEDYMQEIEHVRHILKGKLGVVKSYYKKAMNDAAEKLEFEHAQGFKDKLEKVEKFQSRSLVVNQKISNTDVFSIISDEKFAYINYMKINDGAIIVTKTLEVKKKLNEPDSELLSQIVHELRKNYKSESAEVLTNVPIEGIQAPAVNTVPKIGDKKQLVSLSTKDALYYKKERLQTQQANSNKPNAVVALLKEDLRLTELPDHIECFDNSNFQGTNPVAAMVCFKDGKPSKKDYRHYHVKTVEGPDDFASMREIVYRRYKRLSDENSPLPKLIVIDGGKGQLSAACEALKAVGVYGDIPIVGIAKRLEEIYYPEDPLPLHISKKSASLHLLQKIRDEAHRFAITFHRKKRSQNTFNTELESIDGIGKSTADALLKKFKSVKKVKDLSLKELQEIVGSSKGTLIYSHFHKHNPESP